MLDKEGLRRPGNPFITDIPEIRVRLAQLAFSYGCALLNGDVDSARAIEGEALLLKLYYYADYPSAVSPPKSWNSAT